MAAWAPRPAAASQRWAPEYWPDPGRNRRAPGSDSARSQRSAHKPAAAETSRFFSWCGETITIRGRLLRQPGRARRVQGASLRGDFMATVYVINCRDAGVDCDFE